MTERWSVKENVQFVNLYKDQENLWNIFDLNYKNKYLRRISLEYIAEQMNIQNITDVTRKIKNLRSTYNQELQKIAKSKVSASSPEEIYKPTIKWFDTMHEIMKIVKSKENELTNTMSTTTPGNEATDHIQDQSKNGSVDGFTPAPYPGISPHVQQALNRRRAANAKKIFLQKRNMITSDTNGIHVAINELKELNKKLADSAIPQKDDEYDVFGKHVALQLRQLPLLDMIDAKDEIQQMLSRYRKKAIYSQNMAAPPSYNTPIPQAPVPISIDGSNACGQKLPNNSGAPNAYSDIARI